MVLALNGFCRVLYVHYKQLGFENWLTEANGADFQLSFVFIFKMYYMSAVFVSDRRYQDTMYPADITGKCPTIRTVYPSAVLSHLIQQLCLSVASIFC